MNTQDKSKGPRPARDTQAVPFPTRQSHPEPGQDTAPGRQPKPGSEEDTLDHGLEETFPASDPVSISTRKPRK